MSASRVVCLAACLAVCLYSVPGIAIELELYAVEDHSIHNDWEDWCGAYAPDYPDIVVQARGSLPSVARGLISFDLSGLPQGAMVTSAVLELYCILETEYVTNEFHVSAVGESWHPAGANWCYRDTGLPWCMPGGCLRAGGVSTVTIPSKYGDWSGGPYDRWIEWDVTDMVRRSLLCGESNHGFCVWQTPQYGHGRNQRVHFASMDHPMADTVGPRLRIEYVPPAPPGRRTFDRPARGAGLGARLGARLGAYEFNGEDQYLAFHPYNPGASDVTIEGWFRLDAREATTVFRQEQSGPTGEPRVAVTVEADGRLHVEFDNGSGPDDQYVYSAAAIPLDTWTYFAFTRASGEYRVYINGRLDGVAVYDQNVSMGCMSSSGYIGHRFNSSYPDARYYMDGAVDEFRVSSIARTADQIAGYYERGTPMTVGPHTRILWRMDGHAGSPHKTKALPGNGGFDLVEVNDPAAVPGYSAWTGDGTQDPAASVLLSSGHPNPFNPRTAVDFSLPEARKVMLAVYAVDGSLVRILAEGRHSAGLHRVDWDGTDERGRRVSSGVYFCRLEAGPSSVVRRLVLLK